ncbi:MAG: hypothetical protein RL238_2589 [Actinomycetota bacterium]|jgi:hypothetical protein
MDDTSPQWAAPSGDASTSSETTPEAAAPETAAPEAGATEPITSVVIDTPPKKSRKGLVAAVAVVVVIALGVGGFLLAKGGSDDDSYSLEAAAARAADAAGTDSTINTEAMGQEVSMHVTMANASKLMQMEMDLGGSLLGDDLTLQAILDGPNETMYIGSAFFAGISGEEIDADWIKMDRAAMESAGQDTSFFDQLDGSAQFDPAGTFEKAKSITEIGMEEFEGEQVKHYEVVVAIADLEGTDGILQSQIDSLDGDVPDEVVYDMYVTEDNEIRRVTSAIDFGVAKVKVEIVQHLLDTEPAIEIPSGDDVIDAAEFM